MVRLAPAAAQALLLLLLLLLALAAPALLVILATQLVLALGQVEMLPVVLVPPVEMMPEQTLLHQMSRHQIAALGCSSGPRKEPARKTSPLRERWVCWRLLHEWLLRISS
jgi:hypothetical protein